MREIFTVNNINRSVWMDIQKSRLPFSSLSEHQSKYIFKDITRIKNTVNIEHLHKRQLLQIQLTELILEISNIRSIEKVNEKKFTRKEFLFHSFIELVSEHYKTEKGLLFYASKLNISTTYSSKIIKEISKQTAIFFIDQMTLMQAYKLLLISENSIQQTSIELEFADQASFSKFFKRMTKITPFQFRIKNS